MKEKVISIQQIKEAKRLHRALEITSGGFNTVTFSQMLDKVVDMDRQSEVELADFKPFSKRKLSGIRSTSSR